ncbi:hypothetical protein GW17_00025027 [Ensete ventricosum]|nr:hypothetical protein GW17_00025027 [Ensete ventricosum]
MRDETNRDGDDEVVAGNAGGMGGEPAVFQGTEYSLLQTIVALILWLGAIHFNVALVLVALLFLPARLAAAFVFLIPSPCPFSICASFFFFYLNLFYCRVFGFLLFFMVIPLNDRNRLGRRLSRYHFAPYLFCFVFGYEPHSVLPIALCALADHAGFMPLPKIKVLASSAVAFLKTRKGFVRIAMETGRPVVPVFCFGQVKV